MPPEKPRLADRTAAEIKGDRVEEYDVLVAGAGPTGLMLAYELGRRGIRTALIEQRPAPQFLPKMERCNARTMEIFRRLGLAEEIRAAGLPSHAPMDVFIVTTLDAPPLLSLHYPSVDEAKDAIAAAPNDGREPCEPYQLVSQYTLEPLLKAHVDAMPAIDVRFGHELTAFAEDAGGVTATLATDGAETTVRGKYLVGCDGGASVVRKGLGIKLRGEGNLLSLSQALFRCDALADMLPIGEGPGLGRHYHVADDKATFLIMQDSMRHWTLHSVVDSPEEMKARFEAVVARPVEYEMLYCGGWRQNLLLADRYRKGRVLIAGDAAHLVIPTGGLGMNTGVGDAVDLAWKLWGALKGWGGPGLVDSYEVERRFVGDRNVGASRYASLGRRKWRRLGGPDIFRDDATGTAARENLAAVADVEQRKTNEMIGAELGYRYMDSPIVWNEPGGPEHLFRTYEPTTWPGARLPHLRQPDGSALQDAVPDAFVLLQTGGGHDPAPLAAAFAALGAPFAAIQLDIPEARAVYERDLVLVRPDLHVVWRGNDMPDDPRHLARVATGHATMETPQ